jgi:hypothetical protein
MTTTDDSPGRVLAGADVGDTMELSQYLTEAEVQDRAFTTDGLVLFVKSPSPQATTTYRLRATTGDTDLVLEKPDGDDWTPHCRVTATLTEDTDD